MKGREPKKNREILRELSKTAKINKKLREKLNKIKSENKIEKCSSF